MKDRKQEGHQVYKFGSREQSHYFISNNYRAWKRCIALNKAPSFFLVSLLRPGVSHDFANPEYNSLFCFLLFHSFYTNYYFFKE